MALGMLREAIEKLDDPENFTRDDLIAGFALRDRLDGVLSSAVAAFDRDELYRLDGAASTTAWLKHHCRQAGADAARTASTARKLRSLPHTAQAWRDGELSSGHVRAVVANVAERHVDKFAEVEDTLVSVLAALPVADSAEVMRQWAAAADDADPLPDPDEPADTLHISETLDGRRVINGHLSSDSAVEVEQALAHAAIDDPSVPLSQRNGDALVEIARFFNNHNTKAGARRNRRHLTLLVEDDGHGRPTGRTHGGTTISRATLGQWFCDGMIGRLMTSKGHILDYGTEIPSVPIPLWHAVAARDQHCRAEGCDRATSRCEAHHVHPVEDGGPTVITNLVLVCGHHHRLLHKDNGWTATMEPDGTFHLTAPDGTVRTTRPPGLRNTLWPPGPDDPG